jgi:hypothetical protein
MKIFTSRQKGKKKKKNEVFTLTTRVVSRVAQSNHNWTMTLISHDGSQPPGQRGWNHSL